MLRNYLDSNTVKNRKFNRKQFGTWLGKYPKFEMGYIVNYLEINIYIFYYYDIYIVIYSEGGELL